MLGPTNENVRARHQATKAGQAAEEKAKREVQSSRKVYCVLKCRSSCNAERLTRKAAAIHMNLLYDSGIGQPDKEIPESAEGIPNDDRPKPVLQIPLNCRRRKDGLIIEMILLHVVTDARERSLKLLTSCSAEERNGGWPSTNAKGSAIKCGRTSTTPSWTGSTFVRKAMSLKKFLMRVCCLLCFLTDG